MAVSHFGGSPHGLTLTDAAAPWGAAAEVVPVGYPQDMLIESSLTTVMEGSSDGLTWIELGTVVPPSTLRLGRVRYLYLRGSNNWRGLRVDVGNVIGQTAPAASLAAVSAVIVPCDDRPTMENTKAEIKEWLRRFGTEDHVHGSKADLLNIVAEICDD